MQVYKKMRRKGWNSRKKGQLKLIEQRILRRQLQKLWRTEHLTA